MDYCVRRWRFHELALFWGILSTPVLLVRRRLSGADPSVQPVLAGLSIILALAITDLLPNRLWNFLQLFLAGALSGLAWGIPEERHKSSLPLLAALRKLAGRHNARIITLA